MFSSSHTSARTDDGFLGGWIARCCQESALESPTKDMPQLKVAAPKKEVKHDKQGLAESWIFNHGILLDHGIVGFFGVGTFLFSNTAWKLNKNMYVGPVGHT